jgi:hypothetical protein
MDKANAANRVRVQIKRAVRLGLAPHGRIPLPAAKFLIFLKRAFGTEINALAAYRTFFLINCGQRKYAGLRNRAPRANFNRGTFVVLRAFLWVDSQFHGVMVSFAAGALFTPLRQQIKIRGFLSGASGAAVKF